MDMRQIGKSSLKCAPFALGGSVFGWTIDEKTSYSILNAFVARGLNLIDTADLYSRWVEGNKGGESETIIGNWLKKSGQRSNVLIATKLGLNMGEKKEGLSRKYIIEAVEASLKRLQIETIDLYQSHTDDKNTPLEETLEAFTKLKRDGKVRELGASNYSASRLSDALALSSKNDFARYECLQPFYNLYNRREFEDELAEVCQKNSLGVITYYSLASGFLTGKYRNASDAAKSTRGSGIVENYFNPRGMKILSALDETAEKYKVTPAVVALAWLIARPGITAPIVSATSVSQFEEISKALDVNLSLEAIENLNNASSY